MTVTMQELEDCLAEYKRQFEEREAQLRELEQTYQTARQELTTSIAMCAGAITAFQHLIDGKNESERLKDETNGRQEDNGTK